MLTIVTPTYAHEYELPVLLMMLPPLVAWARVLDVDHQRLIPAATIAGFILFILAASFSQYLLPVRREHLTAYITAAAFLMSVPTLAARAGRQSLEPEH